MIKALANIFRGIHLMIGISLPGPNVSERTFVLSWLMAITATIAASGLVIYLILRLFASSGN
jgi:7,8-dihydro-6-hydroxymethylpterin-pyrophosphokinase